MGANAVTTVPVYASGDVLTAANLNITNSGVPVFATTATRDAAFGGAGEKTLAEGQMCYIEAAPKRFQVYDGTTFLDYLTETTTYSPTYSGLTIGNGTVISRYTQVGKLVFVQYQLTFGSTTSISSVNPTISLPVTAASLSAQNYMGLASLLDSGTAIFSGRTILNSTTVFVVQRHIVTGTNLVFGAIDATTPFTWTTNDILSANFSYLVA